jgi:PIN domain nuclease of toxin-antitoxin system
VNSVVLDASVLLQVAQRERGYERVLPFLPTGKVSAVNLAESVNKVIREGTPRAVAVEALRPLVWNIVPFTAEHGWEVGIIRERAGKLDLSLGDMACLAVARCLQLPVWTNDRDWQTIDFGIAIHLGREAKDAG